MNNVQHIFTITNLKHPKMIYLDTRPIQLLWILKIKIVNNYITTIKYLQQQQEMMLKNIAIDHEK